MASVPDLDPTVSRRLRYDDSGLVAAIVQQHDSNEVLMLGWMDVEAVRRTAHDWGDMQRQGFVDR